MNIRTALITGVTGRNGALLADFLLKKGYEVHGIIRHGSEDFRRSTAHLESIPHFHLHFADVGDSMAMFNVISKVKPAEIYNMAAVNDSKMSEELPVTTFETNGTGILRILLAVKVFGHIASCRVFQACSPDILGLNLSDDGPKVTFEPENIKGAADLYGFDIVRDFRQNFHAFCCSGIIQPGADASSAIWEMLQKERPEDFIIVDGRLKSLE